MFRAAEPNRRAVLRRNLVGAEAGFRKQAIAHRIAETADVAGGNEHLLHRQNRAVHAEHVVAFLHGLAPPEVLEVAFQLGAERAVIPAAVEAAVEFAGLENEAAAFAQRNDFLHAGGIGDVFVGHGDRVGARMEAGAAAGGKTGLPANFLNPCRAAGSRFPSPCG